jgi:membrane-bound lytic murein transglycosylase D
VATKQGLNIMMGAGKNWWQSLGFHMSLGIRLFGLAGIMVFSLKAIATVEPGKIVKTPTQSLPKKTVDIFTVPDFLRRDVDFWAKIYREWDTHQVVIYDSLSKIVLSVVNLPRVSSGFSSAKYKKEVESELAKIQDVIKKSQSGQKLDKIDAKLSSIFHTLEKNNLLKENDLLSRIRKQNGLRSQFEYGLISSGRYADEMKSILKWQNLPDELLAMVFVESLFYIDAISHAGAGGPWGIKEETAKRSGIHVNKFTDERIDPVVSTWGAAQYLKKALDILGEWPLVITAYNYGYAGMQRAVNNLQTKDFSIIIARHESPIFQYASKNYYAEFLAALDTLRHQEKYFPGVKKESRWEYEFVQVQRPVLVDDLILAKAVSKEDLTRLNPGLTKWTISSAEVIPADYALRVPKGHSAKFYAQVKGIPLNKRSAAGLKVSSKYQARGNKNLAAIAKLFGISAERFSDRMGKPLGYLPKGALLIRSGDHLFSPLLELNRQMLSSLGSGQILEKPAEITTPPQ